MENLAAICLMAFFVVFALLSLLAAVMWAITRAFPDAAKQSPAAGKSDPAIIAAVTAAVAALLPGAHVVNMEEDR